MALENHSDFRIASVASKNRKNKNKAPGAPGGGPGAPAPTGPGKKPGPGPPPGAPGPAAKPPAKSPGRRRSPGLEPERPARDQPSASDSELRLVPGVLTYLLHEKPFVSPMFHITFSIIFELFMIDMYSFPSIPLEQRIRGLL